METKSDEFKLVEIIFSLKKVIRRLRAKWLLILLISIVVGISAMAYALLTPVKYSATINFILEEGKSQGSGLAAIAGQIGLDIPGSSSGGELLVGDNIIGLLKSRKFSKETLLTPFNREYSLADRYAEIYDLREKWKKEKKIGRDIFFPVNAERTRLQDSLLQIIQNRILNQLTVSRSDKKMTFFSVSISLQDELLTKLFIERLVHRTVEFYIGTKTTRQRMNVERLEKRADSIGNVLNGKTYYAARQRSSILDVNPAYQTALVAAEVSDRNKTAIGIIYAEIMKNLEVHKASLTQETPVIQVIDGAELPLKVVKSRPVLFSLIGIFAGVLLASFLIVLLDSFKSVLAKEKGTKISNV